ncbi:MAG: TetR/AcrR family transcriptional regulator [Steroidobacteraceae bacterium]
MSIMSYIAERRQEEKDRRRAEILDAAEALYAETGWDAVTMDQVARRARLSRALLYVYFRDKKDLHLGLVERALIALREAVVVARQGYDSGLQQVEAIGRAYLRYAKDTPHYFDACARYQAHEACSPDAHTNEAACMAAGHRVHEVIVESLNRGIADGSIRSDLGDPYATALSLWAFSHGMILIASNKGGQIEHEGTPVASFIEHGFALALRSLRR